MDNLPECALTCLVGAISNSTCSLTNFACICADAQLNAALTPCMAATCTVKESLIAQNFSYSTCNYPAKEDTTTFPIINIIGVIVAIISVALRVTNRILTWQTGMDDYSIITALFVAVAISGVGFPLRTYGLGKNIWAVPFQHINETMKLFFVEEVLYVVCIATIKCSMLLLYLRLFPNKSIRLAIYLALGFTTLWGIGSFFAQIFSCWPMEYYWSQWDGEHEGKCSNHNALLLAHAIINIVLDVVVIALPMPVLFRLHMSWEKRIGMCLMFAVGIVVTVISVFRLVEAVGFNSTTNPTKDFVPVGVWSLLEIDVGIMCSCMPGIRALIKRLYTTFFRKQTGYTYGSSSRRSKPSGGGSSSREQRSGSAHQFTSKSNHSNLESGGGGRFIRLEEVEGADLDLDHGREGEHGWPLRDGPPVPRKDSFRASPRPRGSPRTPIPPAHAHGWHTQYPSSPAATRLWPPPLVPESREGSMFSLKPSTPRSNSAHFTWFRDGDSS